jgi:transcriptional regulator with XRE-family HTH domain
VTISATRVRSGHHSPSLGERLRHIRRLRNLRLRDIAREAGCSESMLSKIESGKAAPSLHTLHKLAEALGTTVAALFDGAPGAALIAYRQGERPILHLEAGQGASVGPSLERIIPYAEGRMLNAYVHVVPPGSGSSGSLKHAGEETGYVLEGVIELTVDGESATLGAGSSFFFQSLLPHSYRNVGTEVARILWVNTPPY